MVEHGRELLGTAIARVLTIDVRGLGITGYQAGDWLRAACHVDIGSAGACRISARITHADDETVPDAADPSMETLRVVA
jgi:arginine decarboxylase